MINTDDNNLSSQMNSRDLIEDSGVIGLAEEQTLIYFRAMSNINFKYVDISEDATKDIFTISASTVHNNYTTGERNTVDFGLKSCERADFENVGRPDLYDMYVSDGGAGASSMLCFDDPDQEAMVRNDNNHPEVRAYVSLSIAWCIGDECSLETEETEAWLNSLLFKVYTVHRGIDFEKYGQLPVQNMNQ